MADQRERHSLGRRRAAFAVVAALLAAVLLPRAANAQRYPNKPVRLILAFGAGGVADVTARLVTEKLGEKLGQRFVIENMPGAGGINAARAVLAAPADGYTLALFSNGTAISVSLFNAALREVLEAPDVKKRALDLGIEANASSPEEILDRLKSDIDKWAGVIEAQELPSNSRAAGVAGSA
jgi:tripartite-type tricarboxylate transporter receptor subunit TctC